MENTTINKQDLIQILKDNLTQHIKDIVDAKAARLVNAEIELKKTLKLLKKSGELPNNLAWPSIQDFSSEYKKALRKLELEISDVINLSAHEFDKYVLDDWNWKSTFNNTLATYGKVGKDLKFN
jgi:hypothetical protein